MNMNKIKPVEEVVAAMIVAVGATKNKVEEPMADVLTNDRQANLTSILELLESEPAVNGLVHRESIIKRIKQMYGN